MVSNFTTKIKNFWLIISKIIQNQI